MRIKYCIYCASVPSLQRDFTNSLIVYSKLVTSIVPRALSHKTKLITSGDFCICKSNKFVCAKTALVSFLNASRSGIPRNETTTVLIT